MARHFDSEFFQEKLGNCSGSHSRRRLTRAGALEDVPGLGEVIFQAARQISVARAGTFEWPLLAAVFLPVLHRHRLGPVLPVTILNQDCDRRSDGLAVPDPGDKLGHVRLDFHSRPTPVPTLASLQLAVHISEVHPQSRRQTVEGRDQSLAV